MKRRNREYIRTLKEVARLTADEQDQWIRSKFPELKISFREFIKYDLDYLLMIENPTKEVEFEISELRLIIPRLQSGKATHDIPVTATMGAM